MKNKFKQMISDDIKNVFLDLNEFAEIHVIEDKETTVIFSSDMGISFGKGYEFGVSKSSAVVYGNIADLPERKESGQSLNVDGKIYEVDEWNEDGGIAEIKISQVRGI